MRISENSMIRTIAIMTINGTIFALACHANAQETEGKTQITNAKVEEREVKTGLAAEVESWAKGSQQARWLGYAVPSIRGDHRTCCGNSGDDWNGGKCGPCRLEEGKSGGSYNLRGGDVKLEGPTNLVVLLRAEKVQVGKIRAFSDDCTLDVGGLQVTWLNGVSPAESVKVLETFVDSKELDERGGERLSRGALMAIAMHADRSADQAMGKFVLPDKPEGMRKEAAFWAGEARGAAGLQLLKRMAQESPKHWVPAAVAYA